MLGPVIMVVRREKNVGETGKTVLMKGRIVVMRQGRKLRCQGGKLWW